MPLGQLAFSASASSTGHAHRPGRYLPAMSWSQMQTQQAFARRSFEASQIEISVTSPSARGGSTTRVFPSPNAATAPAGGGSFSFSFDRFSRSLSIAGDTSASSSGTDNDPLESPPADVEVGKDISMRSSVSSESSARHSHVHSRPSMRHFPSLAALREHRAAAQEAKDKYVWAPEDDIDHAVGQQRSASDMGHSLGSVGVKKRFRAGVEQLLTARGRRRSQLLKKLKDGAGARLSRLFSSSDGSDIWTVTKDIDTAGSETEMDMEVGTNENLARMDPASPPPTRTRSGRGHARRPSMTIDLSTVPTLQNELQTTYRYSTTAERTSTPRVYRSRNGYSRFITLPTIVGSPSIPQSPPEQYYTPLAGSPVVPFGFHGFGQAAEQPQSLMGLFQHHQVVAEEDRRNAMDLDRDVNGSGIDPLDPAPAPAPAPALSAVDTRANAGMDFGLDLDLFSPSIYRRPNLLPLGHTPPISPLELPSLDSPAIHGHRRGCTSSFGMLTRSSGSHSSHESLRARIDGPPTTASLAGVVEHIAHSPVTARPALLPRASADFPSSSNTDRPPLAVAPRASLPNVKFASPATSPPSPRPAFSPTLGLMSPRSPRFQQSGFPPISTPPSLLANPKSLGDPYPNGLSDSASHNLAGNGCACGCEAHAEPNVKRRSSTKRVNDKKAVPQSEIVSEVASQSASIEGGTSDEGHVTDTIASMKVNPYFA